MGMDNNVLVRDGFQPGMTLEILAEDGTALFCGRIKALEEKFVTLVSANDQVLPTVGMGAQVLLQSTRSDGDKVSYSGRLTFASRLFWKISQLQGGHEENMRQFYRQPVCLEGFVMLFSKKDGKQADSAMPSMCTILDISGGGIRMTCDQTYEVGDHLLLAEVQLLEGQDTLNFGCEVRSVSEENEQKFYGCQFEGISPKEQAQLVNAVNVLQKKSFR